MTVLALENTASGDSCRRAAAAHPRGSGAPRRLWKSWSAACRWHGRYRRNRAETAEEHLARTRISSRSFRCYREKSQWIQIASLKADAEAALCYKRRFCRCRSFFVFFNNVIDQTHK